MITTEVELCNHALSYLGESRIASLEDSNERARICNLLYDQTRDELLVDGEWPFAIGRRALAAATEENLTKYEYRYMLPSDYLKLLDVLDDSTYDEVQNHKLVTVEYKIEAGRLLTDLTPCYVRYIKRITKTNLFPEMFAQAFALSLAAKVCPRLSQNFGLAAQVAQAAFGAVIKAKAELIQTSVPRPTRYATWSEVN